MTTFTITVRREEKKSHMWVDISRPNKKCHESFGTENGVVEGVVASAGVASRSSDSRIARWTRRGATGRPVVTEQL